MQPFLNVPSWVLPGARFHFDFVNQRSYGGYIAYGRISNNYYGNTHQGSGPSVLSWARTISGILKGFTIQTSRITDLGMWSEGDRTNNALWSRDFTNAVWIKTNVTAAKNQIGADAAVSSASLLTATANSGTVLQPITITSQAALISFYIKRVSGTGAISITLDGTTYTDVTSQLNSSSYTLVQAPIQTLTSINCGVKIGTSGDSIAIDMTMCETSNTSPLTNYVTGPLYTTTAAARRFSEENAFNSPGGSQPCDGARLNSQIFGSGQPWFAHFEFSGSPSGGPGTILSSDGGEGMYGGADGGTLYAQGATTTNTGNAGFGNINKAIVRVTGAGATACLNGGPLSPLGTIGDSFPKSTFPTHCGLGNNGADNIYYSIMGTIRQIALGDKELTDGELIEFTRP